MGWRTAGYDILFKMFFSEEKNQKTFVSARAARSRPWPERGKSAGDKSLLVLFFRKEHACFDDWLSCWGGADAIRPTVADW
jgi:hypothetical protein